MGHLVSAELLTVIVWLVAAVVAGVVNGLTDRWGWWWRFAAVLPLVIGVVVWSSIAEWPAAGVPVMAGTWLIVVVLEALVQPFTWRYHEALAGLGYWAQVRFFAFRNGRRILRGDRATVDRGGAS